MKKKLITIVMALAMVFAFAACGNQAPAEEDGQTQDPLTIVNVDKENHSVSFTCQVNGDFLTGNEKGNTTTRHFIVAQDGFNDGKALLSSLAPARDIYEAMIEAGFTPGEKNEEVFELAKGETLKDGVEVEYTVSWDGLEEPLTMNDVLVLDNGKMPDIEMHFHGNHANFEKNYSGCVACLDSCYVGITSNCKYGFLNVENNNPNILGDASKLPAGGEYLQVTCSFK